MPRMRFQQYRQLRSDLQETKKEALARYEEVLAGEMKKQFAAVERRPGSGAPANGRCGQGSATGASTFCS